MSNSKIEIKKVNWNSIKIQISYDSYKFLTFTMEWDWFRVYYIKCDHYECSAERSTECLY